MTCRDHAQLAFSTHHGASGEQVVQKGVQSLALATEMMPAGLAGEDAAPNWCLHTARPLETYDSHL